MCYGKMTEERVTIPQETLESLRTLAVLVDNMTENIAKINRSMQSTLANKETIDDLASLLDQFHERSQKQPSKTDQVLR